MSVRKKNLLEAFQNAGGTNLPGVTPVTQPPKVQPETPVAPEKSATGGAVAESAAPPPAPVASQAEMVRAYEDERIEELKARYAGGATSKAGVAMIVLVAFAFGIVIGRVTVQGVEASAPVAAPVDDETASTTGPLVWSDGETNDAGSVPAALAGAGGAPTSGADDVAPLRDPNNEFTIVVATYAVSMLDLAWATHDFLEDEGIPVFRPYTVGDKLVILAGATAGRTDLAPLERRIRGLSYDGVNGAFDDAYTIRISDYVDP